MTAVVEGRAGRGRGGVNASASHINHGGGGGEIRSVSASLRAETGGRGRKEEEGASKRAAGYDECRCGGMQMMHRQPHIGLAIRVELAVGRPWLWREVEQVVQ